ncbi:hypothetical protein FISHEDRAFT_52356, partial [Fistulina hepatica ATCC 64428]
KKGKKVSLNEFLGDASLGSWADEMDSLPTAPAMRNDEEIRNDRYGRRGDDFLASKPDRGSAGPHEDLPLPTNPPFTAFVGNLSFDLTEMDLEDFFKPLKTKSVKIITDRESKPKGFGYVEFEDVEALKEALSKTGSNLAGRTVRIGVAEPPKERAFSGSGGASEDDTKFDGPWRRDKPPSHDRFSDSRDSSRRRFEDRLPSVSEGPSDWRSSRPSRPHTDSSRPSPVESEFRRRPGFGGGEPGVADREDVWTSKFKPAPPADFERSSGRFGRGHSDMGPPPPREPAQSDEGPWRRKGASPNSSTPPTPQLTRRKLELLPRSDSAVPSPLSSPKMASENVSPNTTSTPGSRAPSVSAKTNPFGAAKPVDVQAREREVEERLERERERDWEKHSMSRTSSRTGAQRGPFGDRHFERSESQRAKQRSPTASAPHTPSVPSSPPQPHAAPKTAPNVRPTLSFANVAGNKTSSSEVDTGKDENEKTVHTGSTIAAVLEETTI